MRLTLVLLAVVVVLAVLSVTEAKRKKKVPGPCNVANCKKCNVTGKKCKVCNEGYKAKKRSGKCKAKPCFVNPCQNGGLCTVKGKKKVEKCVCPTGYTGDKCQNAPDPCENVNCQNGGSCSGGSCTCVGAFTGDRCEVDPCSPNPCQNGGSCSAGSCTCASGFSGNNCQTRGGTITTTTWPYGTFTITGGRLIFNWFGGRPQASGSIVESGAIHQGSLNFPDDRTYSLNFYPAEKTIYWGGLKGQTGNIWRGS